MPRYIDADKLKLVLSEDGLIRSDLIALRHIDAMPTADVQEVKHGKWDDSFDGITPYCSICGMSHRGFERTPPYCPHCGSKMDK